MRKLSLIIIAFTLVLFTQCKKEKITENTAGTDGRMVPITLELPVDNGAKTDFSEFLTNPSGSQSTIKWKAGVTETVYLAVPNIKMYLPSYGWITEQCAQMIPLTGTMAEGDKYITFEGEVNSAVLNSGVSYTLYYFGNNGEVNNATSDGVTFGYTGDRITSVTMSLDGQNGSREYLGNYHFASLDGVHVHVTIDEQTNLPSSFAIHPSNRFFTSQVAIAYLDFTNMSMSVPFGIDVEEGYYLYGGDASCMLADEITVSFNGDDNIYNVSYHKSQGDNSIPYLRLNYLKLNSAFIVLAPGLTTIKADGKGTYTFDGGTEANHVYYRYNVPTNQILPLEWK